MRPAIPVLIAALAAGCVAQRNGPSAAPTPSSAKPGRVALTVSDRFEDTDGNGYRDSATVTAYIIAEAADYPLPMKTTGSFDFVLQTRQGNPLARWTFDAAQTAEALYNLAPGPGFIFELSLLRAGTDRLQAEEADLLCTFTPAVGETVRARSPVRVVIGPVGRVRPAR